MNLRKINNLHQKTCLGLSRQFYIQLVCVLGQRYLQKELQKHLRTHGVISNNVSFIHRRQIGSNIPDCGNESRNGQSWKPRMRQHMHRSPSAAKSLSVNLNISICTFWRAVHICCMFLAFVSLSNKEMGSVACEDYFIGDVKKETL
jgi:hypothetical protein